MMHFLEKLTAAALRFVSSRLGYWPYPQVFWKTLINGSNHLVFRGTTVSSVRMRAIGWRQLFLNQRVRALWRIVLLKPEIKIWKFALINLEHHQLRYQLQKTYKKKLPSTNSWSEFLVAVRFLFRYRRFPSLSLTLDPFLCLC